MAVSSAAFVTKKIGKALRDKLKKKAKGKPKGTGSALGIVGSASKAGMQDKQGNTYRGRRKRLKPAPMPKAKPRPTGPKPAPMPKLKPRPTGPKPVPFPKGKKR